MTSLGGQLLGVPASSLLDSGCSQSGLSLALGRAWGRVTGVTRASLAGTAAKKLYRR